MVRDMMSNKIVNEIRKLPIESTPKMLLWVISDIADDDGNTSWYAPRSRLMEETGYSRTTIALCISYLKECGILNVVGGNGRLNQYVVTPNNFNSAVKYEPKKYSKPVSEVDQSTKQTSQPSEQHQSATLTTPVNLATKPVSEVDTIHHSIIYPSVNPSLDNSENAPKDKTEPKAKKPKSTMTTLPVDFKVSDQVKAWANEKGFDRLDEHLENFVGYAIANAKKYADWDQAFMNAIRGNWAKLRPVQQPSYQSSAQQTASEHDRWRQAEQQAFGERDVTPKKPLLIEEVGHA